jgi:hypothetical protein
MNKEERNKLSKLKADVDFLDPVTFEKVCSFNQCKCRECGRRMQSKQDKNKTYDSVMTALASSRYAPGYEQEEKNT